MERRFISTPEGQLSDTDETGTTSMLSSLLGNRTPNFTQDLEFEPKLDDIEELGSNQSIEKSRFLEAYNGPGKIIDSSSYTLDLKLNQGIILNANKVKAVFGSIEKLKESSRHSLRGSILNYQSNTAIGQVLDALHTHDQTMKNLKDALNDIDIVTEKSSMDRLSNSKLDSIRRLDRSIMNMKKEEPNFSKEWVQNEVEIQIGQFKKTLNIDQMQNALAHINKERADEKETKNQTKEWIKHEIQDQITSSSQNLNQNIHVLESIDDLMASGQDKLKEVIEKELMAQISVILQDERKKILNIVNKENVGYITETELNGAIQNALNQSSINVDYSKMQNDSRLELNQKVDYLQKKVLELETERNAKDLSFEELISSSTSTIYMKINALQEDLKSIKNELDLNTQKQKIHANELQSLQNGQGLTKKEFLNKIENLESVQSQSSKVSSESIKEIKFIMDQRICQVEKSIENTVGQISSLSDSFEKEIPKTNAIVQEVNLSNGEDIHSRLEHLERKIAESTTEWRQCSNSLSAVSDSNKKHLEMIENRVEQVEVSAKDQIKEINSTKQTIASNSKIRETDINRLNTIQEDFKLLETNVEEIKAAQSKAAELVYNLKSVVDSRQEINDQLEGKNQFLVQNEEVLESISKLKSDIIKQKDYVDMKFTENEENDQKTINNTLSALNIQFMKEKMAEISQKMDKIDKNHFQLSKEISEKSVTPATPVNPDLKKKIEEFVFSSSIWKKNQDDISHLSSLTPKFSLFESDIQKVSVELKSLEKDINAFRKNIEKPGIQIKQNQVNQLNLDVNTKLSVLTSRIGEVELMAKPLNTVNLKDLIKDIHEVKQKVEISSGLIKNLDDKILSSTMNKALNFEKFRDSRDNWNTIQEKFVDLESMFKTKINPTIQKIESEYIIQAESLRTMNNNLKSLQEEKSSHQMETLLSAHLSKLNDDLESRFETKVDNDVLEELVKHLATRDELKKVAKKKMNAAPARLINVLEEADQNIENGKIHNKLKKDLEIYVKNQIKSLESKLRSRDSFYMASDQSDAEIGKKDFNSIKKFTENLINDKMKVITNNQNLERARREGSTPSDDEMEILEQRVRREFDEKLFLLCSDLSSCKNILASQLYEPFHRCAQWIWKSGHLKLGSAVPWNIQTRNTDEENFLWEQDTFNIKVAEAGLYEITFAFFTKTKPSIQLVVNGESVMSAINSPSYVVHHSSGYILNGNGKMEEGTVSGLSLIDFLALPSKSTISIHYHGVKKQSLGHGFLGLRKL